MLARLLRQVECPIHGVRIIRLPDNRFRAELSEEVPPVRDATGKIDIQGTTQAITSAVGAGARSSPKNLKPPDRATVDLSRSQNVDPAMTDIPSTRFAPL